MVRRKVSLESIVQTAVAQANAQGFESLGLIGVAKALDIKSPSLFNHLRGLPELKRHVCRFALQSLAQDLQLAQQNTHAADAVLACGRAFRQWGKDNPGLLPALNGDGAAPDDGLAEDLRKLAAVLATGFKQAGMDEELAGRQGRALRAFLHGWVGMEKAKLVGNREDEFDLSLAAWTKAAMERS